MKIKSALSTHSNTELIITPYETKVVVIMIYND